MTVRELSDGYTATTIRDRCFEVKDPDGQVVKRVTYLWQAENAVTRHRAKSQAAMRKCLCCERPFMSSGIGNRMCDLCHTHARICI